MDLGFETIGNATLICHDKGPVLATDPWIKGSAYFGSWVTSHEIPDEQYANVKACKYLWVSHGHPDHLSQESLQELKDKTILLPDHSGGRIARDLRAEGFTVEVLEDCVWKQVSDRIRILSIGDIQQDAILLVDLDGRLIVNSNDATPLGAETFVRETVAKYDESFLMALTGYGDADMLNFFDEDGVRIPPAAMKHEPFLSGIETHLKNFGIRYYVPFSAQHKYQRTDSQWTESCVTPLSAYEGELESPDHDILPPFCRYDLIADEATPINPRPRPDVYLPPEDFGDNWSDELERGEAQKIADYFQPIKHLHTFLGFLNFRVGGRDNRIELNPELDRGVTFETPRASLMTCVEWRIFDDILIGNYAKATLHGNWSKVGTPALYPDFTPFVGKFADNGGARSPEELRAYFAEYARRGFFALPKDDGGREMRAALSPYID